MWVWLSKTRHESVSAYIILSINPSLQNQQEATAHYQKFFFMCVSLCGVLTNGAQLHNVRRVNTCVSLLKNPSSNVLSCACFSRTSFHLYLLQKNVPLQVCVSKAFNCVCFSRLFLHMFDPAKHHPILYKVPLSFHFRTQYLTNITQTLALSYIPT